MHARHSGDFDIHGKFCRQIHEQLIVPQFLCHRLMDFNFITVFGMGFVLHAADISGDADAHRFRRLHPPASAADGTFTIDDAV